MTDFIKLLKKQTRHATNKIKEEDINMIFHSYIEDWREEMNERSKDGYNHFYIWEFDINHNVYILENDTYDIDSRVPENIKHQYSCGQFFNSVAFKSWIDDLFPDCKLYYDSKNGKEYAIRLCW